MYNDNLTNDYYFAGARGRRAKTNPWDRRYGRTPSEIERLNAFELETIIKKATKNKMVKDKIDDTIEK